MSFINSRLFRKIELQVLMNITARALGSRPRRLWTLPEEQALHEYADYTRRHLQNGVNAELLRRMDSEAYRVGRLLRRLFFLRQSTDIERFTIALYRNINITLEGHIPGRLCFRQCFFSRYYTPEVCLAASALDGGIMRGLAGEGRLLFEQRITEGSEHCNATYK